MHAQTSTGNNESFSQASADQLIWVPNKPKVFKVILNNSNFLLGFLSFPSESNCHSQVSADDNTTHSSQTEIGHQPIGLI